jgi:hypothetical protein
MHQRLAGSLASLDRSSGADIIGRLERNGWLSREDDAQDARRTTIRLTAAARFALHHVTPRVETVQARLLEPLPARDRPGFVAALRSIAFAEPFPDVGQEVAASDSASVKAGASTGASSAAATPETTTCGSSASPAARRPGAGGSGATMSR